MQYLEYQIVVAPHPTSFFSCTNWLLLVHSPEETHYTQTGELENSCQPHQIQRWQFLK
ncbi:unnamed protein product [Schistosoma margrebowiei]|uniref:Uncharacterized protein n=1 Tax=Schistosoma margrebowiei TaxID=48269 RepID=A0A3P7Z2R2_9TREM|nr:unnamed protein product [Schistosoma margrebowiei]